MQRVADSLARLYRRRHRAVSEGGLAVTENMRAQASERRDDKGRLSNLQAPSRNTNALLTPMTAQEHGQKPLLMSAERAAELIATVRSVQWGIPDWICSR
jgi:hypothetical protein